MVSWKTSLFVPAIVTALSGAVSLTAQAPALAITKVNVIDVTDGRIVSNVTVVVRGSSITSVTPNGTPPPAARVVDGEGKFVIPGLWDMHAHMEASGHAWLPLYVANGVTSIRDMGSELEFILKMKRASASAGVLAPRMFVAGPILDDAPGDWPFRMRVKTPDEGRAAVQLLKQRGVDLIKVHDHTPRDVFFAIADQSRRENLRVAGHVPLKVTPEEAIEAGQTDFEHLLNVGLWKPCSGGQDYKPEACRTFFEMLARRGIWQTPTLAAWSELATIGTPSSAIPADRLEYASTSVKEMWAGNQTTFDAVKLAPVLRGLAKTGSAVVRDMASAGVGILAGCDTMIAGFCIHDELAAMVVGGMTPLAALQTATVNPSRYFGLQDSLGSVSAGKTADLVLLEANPLADISNIRRIHAVVVAGRLMNRNELDDVLAQVKIAVRRQ